MNTLGLLVTDTVRSLLRRRLLLGLMLAVLGLTLTFAWVFGQVVPKINARSSQQDTVQIRRSQETMGSMVQAFFYGATSFGGSLVAMAIFGTAVSEEIRKGTVRITLSKPVSRAQFLTGKYLGGVAVMAAYALLTSAALFAFAKMSKLALPPVYFFAPWLMFCRQLMLGALTMMLSLLMNPFVAAVLAYFAGNGFYGDHNPLYYLLPSYDLFNTFGHVMAGTLITGHDVLLRSLYAFDFVAVMLLLALWRFRTKELIA
jgi:ABC-type transport system involved in multi-copper enzyme maturation permease subunit